MSIFSKNLRHLRESRGLKLDEFEFLGIKKVQCQTMNWVIQNLN